MFRHKLPSVLVAAALLSACGSVESEPASTWQTAAPAEKKNLLEPGAEKTSTVARQEGPYGSIQITLPEGWSYDLCPVDDESLTENNCDYGIRFHPSDVTDGFVELGYHSRFGVCGTGLREEDAALAGDSARIGYYDDEKIWTFITFSGKNEHIVAWMNYDSEWWSDCSVQIMDILNSMTYNPNECSGCIGVFDTSSEIEAVGTNISVENVSPSGATVRFHQYEKSINGDICTGAYFSLQKKTDSGWEDVATKIDNYGFEDIAYTIRKGTSTDVRYDWEWLYGKLSAGEYRIGVYIHGDQKYSTYAEFLIR